MLKLNEFYHFFCCPACKGELSFLSEQVICKSCKTSYTYINGKPHLIHFKAKDNLNDAYNKQIHGQATHSLTEKIDQKIPGAGRVIRSVAHKISPPNTWGHYGRKKIISQLFQNKDSFVVDIGCGASKFTEDCLGIDAYPNSRADVIADSFHLPLKDNCADGIVSCALLEHVPDPGSVLNEMIRVLKPNGLIYIEMPFLQGYHPSPYDGQRYTYQGMEHLLKERKIQNIETGMCAGPGSAVSHLLRNWLALLFSFHSKFIFELLYLFFGWITFPIKYTDYLLKHHPKAVNNAFGIYCLGKK